MAVDRTRFLARWPQFTEASDAAIDESLAAAKLRVSTYYFGDRADEGVMLLTADILARDPGGQFARLVAKDGSTTFGKAFDDLSSTVAVGDRVI